ncbi:MAG TPA: glycosyltransferase [Chthoniobacteraceae bacterium]|nr:glycosyltransferase [Chthoniobacteraceae bacterium]
MLSKADLHLHSRYSDRSAEWLLRRLDFPDSYSDPKALYRQLKAAGMNFVTFTDHNRIDGCLEIADRRDVFISEQITAQFPEDRFRVELLAWNITEAQHREMQALRENIYELQRYLAAQGIVHAVAHPLHQADARPDAAHFEKLILLFRHFEGLNGLRDALLSEVARWVLGGLTPEKIEQFANRHGLEPTHPEPWKKVLIGGSDDHGGIFPASAYTQTPKAKTPAAFLAFVAQGACTLHGRGGTPLALSHGLYNTLYSFFDEKFFGGDETGNGLVRKVFSRFMEGRDPTEFSLTDKIGMVAQGIVSGKIFELAKPAHASLWKQLASTISDADFRQLIAEQTRGIDESERRAFRMANLFVSQLAFRFFTRFVKQLSHGNLIEALQEVSLLGPVLLTVSPYVYAFRLQAPPRPALRRLSEQMMGAIPEPLHNRRRAWFTDTLEDVNGVATTIRKMVAAGVAAGAEIEVITCRADSQIHDIPIRNFTPIGDFELPEYELQKLSFPPILEIIDYIHREKFTELIISTPGPVGITALLAAKLLGLRAVGIYHTDFPQYVRILTDDTFLETLTWKFMHGFYSQLDLLFVNSSGYGRAWVERGIREERIAILPRGLDTTLFHPDRRDRRFWRKYGDWSESTPIVLYVGRISKEKDLDMIAAAYRRLAAEGTSAQFVFVGDGPYAAHLRKTLPEACFTGALYSEALATAYASADLFLFPSTTDTYGNVVVEAQAAGLPAVVSDTGGPKDLVEEGVTGLITKSLDVGSFTQAVRRLLQNPELRCQMGQNARKAVENRDWAEAFRRFWALSPE